MMADNRKAISRRAIAVRKPAMPKWSKAFLAELANSSNVTASAKKAKVATSTVYDARRANPEFCRKWQQALCEGYDHLEMELLHRLRTGEVKPAAGAKKGVRTYENATALRLLVAHRGSVAQQRAVRDNEDTESIILSINTKLELMRQRRLDAAHEVVDGGE